MPATDQSKIATIEDTLIASLQGVLGQYVRTIDWAPPDWDEDFIKRTLLALPGAFVIFQGANRIDEGGGSIKLDTQWSIVAATSHVQNAKVRARGDKLKIGCYEILEASIAKLDGMAVPDIGTLFCIDWNNEFALKLEQAALMTQSASFHMLIDIDPIQDGGNIAPFLRFYDTFDVGAADGAPPITDHVDLPQ